MPRPASVHAALATAPHRNTFSSKMRMLVLSSQISKKLSKTSHLSLPLARHTDLARQLPVFNQAEPFGADRYAGRAVSSSLDGRWWRPRASWACCTEGVGFLAALLQAVGRVLFFAHGLATVRLSVQPVSVAARSWRRSLCSQRQRSRHSCGRRSSHPALCRCASPVCQQDGGVEARVKPACSLPGRGGLANGTFMGRPAPLSTWRRLPACLAPDDETAPGDTVSLVFPHSVHLLRLCQTLGFQGSK